MANAHDRFWSHVDRGGPKECWNWTGATTEGYGRFKDGVLTWRAHRWAYVNAFGAIPDGLVIDHLCRNRACVNPAHMEVVTDRENILRGEGRGAKQARQTHCKNGHEFTSENTYIRPSDGGRHCRICLRAREAARKDRKNMRRQNWKERAELAEAEVVRLTQERDEAVRRSEIDQRQCDDMTAQAGAAEAALADTRRALEQIAYTKPANNAQGNLNIFRETAARALAATGGGTEEIERLTAEHAGRTLEEARRRGGTGGEENA